MRALPFLVAWILPNERHFKLARRFCGSPYTGEVLDPQTDRLDQAGACLASRRRSRTRPNALFPLHPGGASRWTAGWLTPPVEPPTRVVCLLPRPAEHITDDKAAVCPHPSNQGSGGRDNVFDHLTCQRPCGLCLCSSLSQRLVRASTIQHDRIFAGNNRLMTRANN